MFRCQTAFAPSLIVAFGLTSAAVAQDQADLAKAAQNPVAAMISLPFQNNTLFEVGPDDDVANVLNIQPDPVHARRLEHHQPHDRAGDLPAGRRFRPSRDATSSWRCASMARASSSSNQTWKPDVVVKVE